MSYFQCVLILTVAGGSLPVSMRDYHDLVSPKATVRQSGNEGRFFPKGCCMPSAICHTLSAV